MIVLIDNYDSFVYNLYQYIGTIVPDIKVFRNDAVSVKEIETLSPEKIILSPGPGKPAESGVCPKIIKYFAGRTAILGICLGHQAICESFGATVSYAKKLMHGKQSVAVLDTDTKIFKGLPKKVTVGRYHSLAAVKETMPQDLQITASSDDGEIMAVQHKKFEIYGLQFHPESVLTEYGMNMIENFLRG